MRKIYISLAVFGVITVGAGIANISTLVKSAFAGHCQCPEGCPCSHCSGKARECNCKK
ncbi:MAG: hypothetical protein L3J18_03530 [Candidatus Brocadia sp.]|uniref:Uncharacterized protein n=1 Tax=Candidatus Brocadia fulgida TaxID=380242 RepID=A0A0M2UXC8_9BACT|nr:MAG: hypothetical protein BROFUL_02162 [Candidatus Brocadia fulgida]MBV6519491.1 hypothetical protein [Candidatus Brocadia fulgida]MCC6326548.1 hypothetical protein [Candidatus Brocadia sp.]UJS21388.1 MAG: hypothetical protein L3J18_03530 [Candidatus Brocadia sp.]